MASAARVRAQLKRWRAQLQTPGSSVGLVILLLLSLVWISRDDEWHNRSTVGRFVREQLPWGTARPTGSGGARIGIDDRYFVWIDGEAQGLRLDHYVQHLEERRPRADGEVTVWVFWRTGSYRAGWWAIMRSVRWEGLQIHDMNRNATPAQFDEAKRLYVAIDPRYVAASDGDVKHVRPLVGGIALDSATLLAALFFVISLGWIPRLAADRCGRRRISQGLCPTCKYDLAGLGPGPGPGHRADSTGSSVAGLRCPECGEPFPAV